jgi:hypothetical protein
MEQKTINVTISQEDQKRIIKEMKHLKELRPNDDITLILSTKEHTSIGFHTYPLRWDDQENKNTNVMGLPGL